jgi:hypothetical protein
MIFSGCQESIEQFFARASHCRKGLCSPALAAGASATTFGFGAQAGGLQWNCFRDVSISGVKLALWCLVGFSLTLALSQWERG